MENEKVYDVIGVGFGPANIAVACAMEELNLDKEVLFLEARSQSIWQEHMLLEDSDIQNHPLRDLVTPRNPRSKYSFTNFLFEHDRLFEHFNTGMHFPYRIEFTQYVSWVASHFEGITKYSTEVKQIDTFDNGADTKLFKITDGKKKVYYSKSLVVAPGRTPNIPEEFMGIDSSKIVFLTDYLKEIKKIPSQSLNKVAVVGGSQSAIELILHLSNNYPETDIVGISRSFGFKQKDINPFTGEVYFPEFVDLFHKSEHKVKKRLINDLHLTNYSASDLDVLESLYKKIYLQKICDKQKIFIKRSTSIKNVTKEGNQIKIVFDQLELENVQEEKYDLVLLATGFKNTGKGKNEERLHPILRGLQSSLELGEQELIKVNLNYSVNVEGFKKNSFFLNGLCESSHGMGDAGSFSLLSLRAQKIVESLKFFFNKEPAKTNQANGNSVYDWVM